MQQWFSCCGESGQQQVDVDHVVLYMYVCSCSSQVKVIAGLGTTIDVILRNGILNEGDTLVLTGIEGPFVTQARALLMPQALRELRVKNAYINHKVVIASQGVKICAKELEKTLAGTPLLVAKRPDEIDVLKVSRAQHFTSCKFQAVCVCRLHLIAHSACARLRGRGTCFTRQLCILGCGGNWWS